MAKKKEQKQEEPQIQNKAEVFARQRHLKVLSSERGHEFIRLLNESGIKIKQRTDGINLIQVSINVGRVVIDLTK